MCPYYPAGEGLARVTTTEVTDWELETAKGATRKNRRKRYVAQRGSKGEGSVVKWRRAAKRQLIIPSPPKTSRANTTHSHFVHHFCLRAPPLSFPLLLIYGILQVAPRRCRALQFMSNLVNILSPVRPVSRCFSSLPVFPPSSSPPRVLSSTPPPSTLSSQSSGDREKSSLDSTNLYSLWFIPLCCFAGSGGGESFSSERRADEATLLACG